MTNSVQRAAPASDRLLYPLLDPLFSLIGLYTLNCRGNQETFSWGKNPTPLQQLCSLPFRFYCDPQVRSSFLLLALLLFSFVCSSIRFFTRSPSQLRGLLLPTIAAVSFGNPRSLQIVAKELSPTMLADFIREQRAGWRAEEGGAAEGARSAVVRAVDVYSWRYVDHRIPRRLWNDMIDEFVEAAR